RTDGVLAGVQRRRHLLLRHVEHVRGLVLDGLQLLRGLVADVPGLAVRVLAKVIAPEPHGEASGERADHETYHRSPPLPQELTPDEWINEQEECHAPSRPGLPFLPGKRYRPRSDRVIHQT